MKIGKKTKTLSSAELLRIADLANLELEAEEKKKFASQLTDILLYVKKLQEIKLDNVPPTSQVSNLRDVLRNDEVIPWDETEVQQMLALSNLKDGKVRVKRVL